MNKVFVNFSLEEMPVYESSFIYCDRGYDVYSNPSDLEKMEYRTENLNNVIVSECVSTSCLTPEFEIDRLKEDGFEMWDQSINGVVIYQKREHFCFTDQTKKLLEKLFAEERQKMRDTLVKAKEEAKSAEKKAQEIGQSFDEFVDMIDTSGFFKRLKYLFTGRIE